jgi:predicted nucleotidyltransferase
VVDEGVAELIRRYLRNLEAAGIHTTSGVVFGSVARGEAGEWNDIDLVVLSPRFDGPSTPPLARQTVSFVNVLRPMSHPKATIG